MANNKEDIKPLMDAAFDMIGDIIKDEKPVIESKEMEFSTGKEKITMVTFAYKEKDVFPTVIRFIENALNSENTIKYIEQAIKFNQDMGLDTPEFDVAIVKEGIEKGKEEFSKNKEQITSMLESYFKFNALEFSFGVDKDDFMRFSSFKLDMEINNPFDPSQKIPVKFDFTSTADQYNAVKAEDIKTTTVDSSNSITLEDLMKSK